MKKTISIFVMIAVTLSCIISYPAVSPASQVHAASKSNKVKVVIVDSKSKEWQTDRLKQWLKDKKISYVYTSTSNVDPAKYDGLIIPGGADVSPSLYGEKNRHSKNCNESRDKMQKKVILNFKKVGKPILGICRGCQIINVAMGGSLRQHIGNSHMEKNITIHTKSGSFIRKAYGKKQTVYCKHHQAVKKLGKGMIKTAWKGKTVEAIQHKTLPIYGVQFHPENKGKYGEAALAKQFKKTCLSVKKKQAKAVKAQKAKLKKPAKVVLKTPADSDITESTVTLKWNKVKTATGYQIFRNGKKIKTVKGGSKLGQDRSSSIR